jgi:hypothetical protein
MWMELASHLGLSLQRCKQETSSTDFVNWQAYLMKKMNEPSRSDYYLMRVAQEIRRAFAAKNTIVSIKDFFVKFTFEKKKPEAIEEIEPGERVTRSKGFWMGLVGLARKK